MSRLLDLFHREELIEREPRGPILAVHLGAPDPALGRGLPLRRGAPVRPGRAPARRPGRARAPARRQIPHALTARAGAAALSGTALPGVVAAYVDNPERVAAILGAEPIDTTSGANLLLIDPFDPFVFDGTWEASGLRYAARAQIIADLLGSPAPAPAQAASLLEFAGRARARTSAAV